MSSERVGIWVLATALLFAAHVIRITRQSLLFNPGDIKRPFDLLVALSLGYVVNAIVPFRIGEIVRILYASVRTHLRISQVAATVVVERVSDLMAISLLLPIIQFAFSESVSPAMIATSGLMLAVSLLFLVGGVLIRSSQWVRRAVWKCASIFNERIMQSLVNLAWTTSDLQRTRLPSARYVGLTVLMWSLYFVAYGAFGVATGLPFSVVSIGLLGNPLRSLAVEWSADNLLLVILCVLPAVMILLYGLLRDHDAIRRILTPLRNMVLPIDRNTALEMPVAFRDVAEYGSFLRAHFSANAPVVARFGIEGGGNAVIHRMLPGGSDALTAVVEVEDRFSIRKFAIDRAAGKLADQAAWLSRFGEQISLCQVIDEAKTRSTYRYDMPYLATARDFYEFIHMNPIDASRALMSEIFERVDSFHDRHRQAACDQRLVDDYLEQKVSRNAADILDFARSLVGESYQINGQPFRLCEWECLQDPTWLRAQISSRETTMVHGDLTIENIIVAPEARAGWYLIDPNPDNIFNTELIDWAKLMQSLNLGYEGLNRIGPASISGGSINFIFSRSTAYGHLHQHYLSLLAQRYDARARREIAFHELVNYLRLTPYKIRHAPEKALTFFANTAFLLRSYRNA